MHLPRKRKVPRRYDEGSSEGDCPEAVHRPIYFQLFSSTDPVVLIPISWLFLSTSQSSFLVSTSSGVRTNGLLGVGINTLVAKFGRFSVGYILVTF